MFRLLRPKILTDVKPRQAGKIRDSYGFLPDRINLSYSEVLSLPLTKVLKAGVIIVSLVFLLSGSVAAPTTRALIANAADNTAERQALEAQLSDLEKQIDNYQGQITSYQKQGKSLKGEITNLNNKISKLNLEIKAINLSISQLNQKIDETQYQITDTESNIEKNKQSLAVLLKNLYESEQTSMMEVFLRSQKLSDFFNNVNSIMLLQNNMQATIVKISDLKKDLEDQKDQLSLAKADKSTLREYQQVQKNQTEQIKSTKNDLLAVTKGQESKYQALLVETKKTAAEIRSRLFELLGGGELTFEKAYEFAKFASQSTGVDPAMILAVLDRESALGKNVGKCGYQTAMHPTRDVPLFLALLSDLNISPDSQTVLVSCANKDGAYGGAMGPAQFIPSTWNLYKDEVSKITGHSPANPWNNSDAFVATALYLEDAENACASSYTNQTSRDRCAAARYYAGGRWRNFLWTYGDATVTRAAKFRDDIETITS